MALVTPLGNHLFVIKTSFEEKGRRGTEICRQLVVLAEYHFDLISAKVKFFTPKHIYECERVNKSIDFYVEA